MLQFRFQSQMSRPCWFEFTTAILGLICENAHHHAYRNSSAQWAVTIYCLCANSICVNAVDHVVAPSPSNNTRKICIWICAWNNYVSYTLVCVHFIVCSMHVSSCSTPSFSSPSFYSPANSSPANSAIPSILSPFCVCYLLNCISYVYIIAKIFL